MHFEGGGPSKPRKKKTSQQQSVLRRGSVMLAACIQGYQEVLLPNMGSARDKRGSSRKFREINIFREEWPFADKG